MAANRGQILPRKYGFLVRVFVGRDAIGTRIYDNQKVTGTKKDAQKVLTAVLRKLDMGELLLEPSTQTVEAYCEDWLQTIAQPRLAKSTFKNYCHYMRKQVYPSLGKRKLVRLEPKEVEFMGRRRRHHASPLKLLTARSTNSTVSRSAPRSRVWIAEPNRRIISHRPLSGARV